MFPNHQMGGVVYHLVPYHNTVRGREQPRIGINPNIQTINFIVETLLAGPPVLGSIGFTQRVYDGPLHVIVDCEIAKSASIGWVALVSNTHRISFARFPSTWLVSIEIVARPSIFQRPIFSIYIVNS